MSRAVWDNHGTAVEKSPAAKVNRGWPSFGKVFVKSVASRVDDSV